MKRRSFAKTVLAAVLVLALGLSLAACGEKEPEDYGIEVEGPKRTSAPVPSQPASSSASEPDDGIVWALEPRADLEITRSLADYDPPARFTLDGQARLAFFEQGGSVGVISLTGEIVVPAAENVHWCRVCGITNADESRIFDASGAVVGSGGHGGSMDWCVYDEASGRVYWQDYGYYTAWSAGGERNSGYIMAPVVKISLLETDIPDFPDYLADGIAEYPVEVTRTGEYMLLDLGAGRPVNNRRYTAYEQRGSYFMVQQNGLWGCVDGEGHELLSCTYLEVRPFVDGVAAVRTGTGWGFVDMDGRAFTAMDFLGAASAFEGRAWVKTEDGWGVIELAKNPA